MSKLFSSRRRIVIVGITGALVLGGAGTAFAYFTSTGSGTGSASVGSAGSWGVAETGTPTGGPIFPGSGTETITFTITNNGSGNQEYTTHGVVVNADGSGNIETGSGNTAVSGCTASWFNASVASDNGINTSIASGGTATITVNVTMTDAATSQNACQSATPNVTLSVG